MTEIRPGQSTQLLQALHILTREGKLNQDSRRKLKQVYHLYNFILPILEEIAQKNPNFSLVDHGAGKSYLGFIIYDLFFKDKKDGWVYGIETRQELVEKSQSLALDCQFQRMKFLNLSIQEALESNAIGAQVEIVTALHACDTATDDAIEFGLSHQCQYLVLIPCCQAELAQKLRPQKAKMLEQSALTEIWRHPLHTREFAGHLTNVLRCLWLEGQGYQVTVTELTGWEHSMKNELILAKKNKDVASLKAQKRLLALLKEFQLEELSDRYLNFRK